MGNPWMKALFANLAPKPDKDDGYSSATFEDSRSARWNRQRTASSPPKVVKHALQDYDLAAHASSSLQIDDSRPYSRNVPYTPAPPHSNSHAPSGTSPNSQWRYSPGTAQASSLQHRASSSLTGRRIDTISPPPPPVGPRPVLYPQEVPSRDTYSKQASEGYVIGFINPSQTPPRNRQDVSTSLSQPQIPRSSPHRTNPHELSSTVFPRPHHASIPEEPVSMVMPPPSTPHRPYSDPQTPKKVIQAPVVSRSSSDESNKGKPNQCYGTTGAGKRCTRIVKSKGTTTKVSEKATKAPDVKLGYTALRQLDRRLSIRKKPVGPPKHNIDRRHQVLEIDSDGEEDFDVTAARLAPVRGGTISEEEDLEELPVFCFQHVKQTLEQRGTFINAKYVDFQDWIPAYLPQETQLQLRHEMAKPSVEKRAGYIYVHEFPLSRGSSDGTTFIKLGRSVRPITRLSEWRSQCKSRQPIVRDIFPLHVSHPLHPGHTANSLINTYRASPGHQHGRLLFADNGVLAHQRWERLCLIELAGIAAVQSRDRQEDEGLARQACIDCGKIHVELFLVNKGSYEKDIRDMVLRWQRFVETIV